MAPGEEQSRHAAMDFAASIARFVLGSLIAVTITTSCLVSAHGHSHGHGAEVAGERPTGLHDPKVVQDPEHIKEHYEGRAELNEEQMSPQELEFHYFKLHDFDNNTKLDGLEILAALTHLLPYDERPDGDHSHDATRRDAESRKEEELKYYTDIIDSVFEEDDLDKDGYLTYVEFVLARQREESRNKQDEEAQKAGQKH